MWDVGACVATQLAHQASRMASASGPFRPDDGVLRGLTPPGSPAAER